MAAKRHSDIEGIARERPDNLDSDAVEAARADVDQGRTVPYAKVRRWLLSWGSKKELPRPRCK